MPSRDISELALCIKLRVNGHNKPDRLVLGKYEPRGQSTATLDCGMTDGKYDTLVSTEIQDNDLY